MVLEFTAGSIFQQGVGGNTPPNPFLIPTFPELAYDTFVSVGGLDADSSEDVFQVGGAGDLTPGAAKKFDTQGINITWQPALGVFLRDPLDDFMTARITLSNDAQGSFHYIGVGNSDPRAAWWEVEGTIEAGVMSFGGPPGEGPVINLVDLGVTITPFIPPPKAWPPKYRWSGSRGSGSLAAVPEPSRLMLSAFAAMFFFCRRHT